jgi:hypothetical protein
VYTIKSDSKASRRAQQRPLQKTVKLSYILTNLGQNNKACNNNTGAFEKTAKTKEKTTIIGVLEQYTKYTAVIRKLTGKCKICV